MSQDSEGKSVSILPIEKWTVQWPITLAQMGITGGTFGGSILFSIIISDVPDTRLDSPFGTEKVRLFLAASWMTWITVLGLSSLTLLLYTDEMLTLLFRLKQFREEPTRARTAEVITILELMGTSLNIYAMLTSFMLMGLAVVAYIGWVGWTIVGLVGLGMIIAITIYTLIAMALLNSLRKSWRDRKKDPKDRYAGSRIVHVFVITDEDRKLA